MYVLLLQKEMIKNKFSEQWIGDVPVVSISEGKRQKWIQKHVHNKWDKINPDPWNSEDLLEKGPSEHHKKPSAHTIRSIMNDILMQYGILHPIWTQRHEQGYAFF